MIFKVASAFFFMFQNMIGFGVRRLFGSRDLDSQLEAIYLRWSAKVLKVFQIDMEVEGRENLPAESNGKLVVMCNHQSQLDIPTLVAALNRRLGFVAKKELSRIPLLSFWMKEVGCVFIDRSDRTGAHRALEKAAAEIGLHPLVVFPEGTRSKDGRLLPLKLGGFRLALLSGADVLPVLIQGTRDAGENHKKGAARIPVRVRIFPVIDTKSLGDRKSVV